MRKRMKKKVRIKKIGIVICLLGLLIIGSLLAIYFLRDNDGVVKEQGLDVSKVDEHYNDMVITLEETDLYWLENDEYINGGKISKDVYLSLDKDKSNYEKGYFFINNLSDNLDKDYYIYYDDVIGTEEEVTYDDRYKKYIPYNKTIVTNDNFSLYGDSGDIVYKFSLTREMPIIINKDDFYGVEFDNQILYIKNEDIKEIKDMNNSDDEYTKAIAVLNYHFVYNPEVDVCDQIICHTEELFESHLKYIKDNNIFTPTLKELEMYIDGNVQLPKSVVITIDDGWHSLESAALLNKYELNGTVFLITSEYDKGAIQSKYVEVHSHTHKMHKRGDCPTGQGGGLQCLSEEYIQEDLKISRERLNNTTYLCYPFYEYNGYSIEQLKKAGFTMAFAGYGANGVLRATVGIDKFQVPRYVIYSNTSVNQLKNMIG